VDILEGGGGSHDSYGVLVIQSPTNGGPSSINCDTTVTGSRQAATNDDDRRWLGRAYTKQMSTWDSVLGKLLSDEVYACRSNYSTVDSRYRQRHHSIERLRIL